MTELTLREYTQEIEGMLERSSYDEAVAHCRHILQQYPKYVEAYRLLGKMALDREDDQHATDLFARVLSADPSDFVSRAGLAIINDRKDSLPDAVWHMERAYEVEPGNPVIQAELRKLYGRRDGAEPQRIPLTRGALARLYMNGALYSEAVAELRMMLAQEPARVDLQVLLTEALWRNEQKLEASDVALQVLDKMPYCLDTNLILGEIWMSGGREEDAEVPLKRAMALDPEGVRAAMLFGKSSPIPAKGVPVTAFEYTPPVQETVTEEAPEWLTGLGAPAEATAGGAEEVPAWLQGLGLPSPEATVAQVAPSEIGAPPVLAVPEEAPGWLLGPIEAMPPTPIETAPAIEIEQEPDWLSQLRAQVAPLPATEAAGEEAATPDWLLALKPSSAEQPAPTVEEAEEGVPDWLAQLRAEVAPLPAAEAEAAPVKEFVASEEAEIPDWFKTSGPEAAEQPAPSLEEAETPDWLAQLGAQAALAPEAEAEVEEPLTAPEPAEIPDWLQALKPQGVEVAAPAVELPEWLSAFPAEPVAAEPVETRLVATKEQPARLEGEGAMPKVGTPPPPAPAVKPEPPKVETGLPAAELAALGTGAMLAPEAALAFFARLSAGKEAELQAQAQAEAEERMASIMGRKPEAKPEAVTPPPTPVEAPPLPTVQVPPSPQVAPPKPAAEEQPAWLTGEGALPSAEEAMAFFAKLSAGKEAELQAQAQAEAEERMASIMGRKPEAKPEVKPEAVTPPPTLVEAPPLPAAQVPPSPQVEPPKPAAEEQPAWLTGEGALPSAEEAMAFFAQLSAGKEAELQAQAEAEAEERMASIMGRKPKVAPVMPPSAPVKVPQPPKVEAPQPVEEAPAMPEWPVEPEIELAPEALVEAAPAPQVPTGWAAWAEVTTSEETLPVIEPEVVEGLMAGWPAPEITAVAVVEQAPVEAAPAARVPVVEVAGPDWWYQTLADEEAPAEEVPGEQVVLLAEAISFAPPSPIKEPVSAPVAPGVMLPPTPVAPVQPTLPPSPPPKPKPAARPPKRLVRAKPTPAVPPTPAVDMESILARLRANPDDHRALLDMARGHTQLGDLHAAHNTYEELVRRNVLMDDVISDLEKAVEDNPDHVDLIRLLGDAHMKAGNLQKALKLYRQALKKL